MPSAPSWQRKAVIFSALFLFGAGLLISTTAVSAQVLTAKPPEGWSGFTAALKKAKLKHYTGFAAGNLSIKVSGKKETSSTTDATIYSNLTENDSAAALKLCRQVAIIARRTKNLTIAFSLVAENIPTTGGYDAQTDGATAAVALAAMATDYQCTAV